MNRMIIGFPLCAGCGKRQNRPELKASEYFCSYAKHTLLNGIVTDDTDGTKCVELGVYLP